MLPPNGPVIHDLGQAMAAVQQNGEAYRNVSSELQNVREVALAALRRSGYMLRYMKEEFRNDKEMALVAIEQQPSIFNVLSPQLQNDRDVAIASIVHGLELSGQLYATEATLDNRELMILALSQPKFVDFPLCSERLRGDKELVLMAVRHHPAYLECASDALRNDREVVLAAVQKAASLGPNDDRRALEFASPQLQSDPEILAAADPERANDVCVIL